jgi:hypothetical protein
MQHSTESGGNHAEKNGAYMQRGRNSKKSDKPLNAMIGGKRASCMDDIDLDENNVSKKSIWEVSMGNNVVTNAGLKEPIKLGALNCQGLENGLTVNSILDFQKKEGPDVHFLSERKLDEKRLEWV